MLLIDDIQFIAGKHHTEEEFFHTFNALHDAGSQIVLSADRSPSEISTLADRLSDRFEWGLTVPLEAPNLATRLTVLRHLVTEAGLEISDQDALTLLARRVQTNLRQLRGALTRTMAESSLTSSPIDSDLIGQVFPETETSPAASITPELIRSTVAAHFNTDVETLQSRRRDRNTATARHVAVYLTREMTSLSLPQIGGLYGGRDHTTILNSIERIDGSLGEDADDHHLCGDDPGRYPQPWGKWLNCHLLPPRPVARIPISPPLTHRTFGFPKPLSTVLRFTPQNQHT